MWSFVSLLLSIFFPHAVLSITNGGRILSSEISRSIRPNINNINNINTRAFTSPGSRCTAHDKAVTNRALLNLFRLSLRVEAGLGSYQHYLYSDTLFMNIFEDERDSSRSSVRDWFRAVKFEASSSWVAPASHDQLNRGWINITCEHYGDPVRECHGYGQYIKIDAPDRPLLLTTRIILVRFSQLSFVLRPVLACQILGLFRNMSYVSYFRARVRRENANKILTLCLAVSAILEHSRSPPKIAGQIYEGDRASSRIPPDPLCFFLLVSTSAPYK